MDFGFLRASTDDYTRPNKDTDRIVLSYDGHCAYLLIVDSASRRVWAFLTKSKAPLAILGAFMSKYGVGNGIIRTDQGGELARSKAFRESMLKDYGYVVECTGADSPSQNGGAEIYTIPWQLRFELYSMVLASPRSSGLPLSSTPSISITDLCTPQPTRLPTKVGTVESLTLHILRCLVLVCASNARVHGVANLTAITSRDSSLVILRRIKTSCISTHPPESLNLATTLCLMKHGIYNLTDLLLLNSSSI